MNSHEEPQATRKEKSRIRVWLELAGAVCVILTAFAGASIWLFQNVSDKAVARAVLPMKLERLEQTSKDHETRLAEVERKAQASEIDRAQLHKEMAESRAAFTAQIRELFEQLQKRLDRLDDKADRIGERVGVVPRSKFDTRPAFMPAFRQYPPAVATVGAIQYATDAGDFAAHERFRYEPETLTLFVDKLRLPGGSNEIRMYTGDVLMNTSQRLNLVEGTALTFGAWRDAAPDAGLMRVGYQALRVTDGGAGLGSLHAGQINTNKILANGTLELASLYDRRVTITDGGGGMGDLEARDITARNISSWNVSTFNTLRSTADAGFQLQAEGATFKNGYPIVFTNGGIFSTPNAGIAHTGPGALAITDGGAGYGSLKVGSLVMTNGNSMLDMAGGTMAGGRYIGELPFQYNQGTGWQTGGTIGAQPGGLYVGDGGAGLGSITAGSLNIQNGSTTVAYISNDGSFTGGILVDAARINNLKDASTATTRLSTNVSGAGIAVFGPTAANVPLVVYGAPGHTANLAEWRDYTGAAKAFIDPSGLIGAPYIYGTNNLNLAGSGGTVGVRSSNLEVDWTLIVGNPSNNLRITNACIFNTNEYGNRWQMVDHGTIRLGLADSSGTNYDGGALELGIDGGKSAICGGAGGIGFLSFWTGSDYTHPAMQIGADKRLFAFGDVITPTATTGPVLTDRTTGNRWRLKVDSGTLGIELAP